MEFRQAIGYDDISLLPNFSDISSRKEIDTSTKISRNNHIKIPIILSPMDTVSSVKSCIKMNKIGGAGVLHRFMSVDDQKTKSKIIKDIHPCDFLGDTKTCEEKTLLKYCKPLKTRLYVLFDFLLYLVSSKLRNQKKKFRNFFFEISN